MTNRKSSIPYLYFVNLLLFLFSVFEEKHQRLAEILTVMELIFLTQ